MPSFFDFLALIRSFQAIPNATPFLWRLKICPRSGKSSRLRFARPWTEMTRSASSAPPYSAGVLSFVAPRAWTWAQITGEGGSERSKIMQNIQTLHWHCMYLCIFVALNYIAFHYVTLPSITLHCLPLRYIAFHYVTLHSIALHCIPLHSIAFHCTPLHSIAFHCIPLHYIAFHCITLRCTTFYTYNMYLHTHIYYVRAYLSWKRSLSVASFLAPLSMCPELSSAWLKVPRSTLIFPNSSTALSTIAWISICHIFPSIRTCIHVSSMHPPVCLCIMYPCVSVDCWPTSSYLIHTRMIRFNTAWFKMCVCAFVYDPNSLEGNLHTDKRNV